MDRDKGYLLEEEIIAIQGDYKVREISKRYMIAKNDALKASEKLLYKTKADRERRYYRITKDDSKPATIKTSCTLLVMDEEKTVRDAITSVYDYVDEIVVLDTGSTDNTPEIVSQFKKVSLHQKQIIPWNFSEARNYLLSLVNGKYVISIDADEENDAPFELDGTIGFLNITEMLNDGVEKNVVRVPRMFPMTDRTYYDGQVHNRLVTDPKFAWSFPDVNFRHWKDRSEDKTDARTSRSKDFLKKIKLETFSDYFKFAKLCMANALWDELINVWEDGYNIYNDMTQYKKRHYPEYLLFICYAKMMKLDFESWIPYCQEHIDLVGEEIETSFCMFTHHYAIGEFREALDCADTFLLLSSSPLKIPFVPRNSLIYKPEIVLKRDFIVYGLQNGVIK